MSREELGKLQIANAMCARELLISTSTTEASTASQSFSCLGIFLDNKKS